MRKSSQILTVVIAVTSLATAFGAAGPGLAQVIPATTTGPTSEADFTRSFAPIDAMELAAPEVEPGSVDLATIDPVLEPDEQHLGSGVASYYGRRFAGRPTANGERFDPGLLTAAHRSLPFGSKVRVTNPRNGRSVIVRINDRGPFVRGRTIDLSRSAAEEIGIVRAGHGTVDLALLTS